MTVTDAVTDHGCRISVIIVAADVEQHLISLFSFRLTDLIYAFELDSDVVGTVVSQQEGQDLFPYTLRTIRLPSTVR